MKYDFNTLISRKNTGSSKWEQMYKTNPNIGEDIVPLSVADMELKNAPEIIEGLREYLKSAVLGYTSPYKAFTDSVVDWMQRRHNFSIKPQWIVNTAGVVPAFFTAIRAFTKPGDGVVIMSPVYYPFYNAINFNERTLVDCPLIEKNGYYTIDFEKFDEITKKPENKLFLFCSPHNPVGRVWKKEELAKVGELCLKYNVRIIADEIWRDIIMPGVVHTPMASISKEIEDITVTCFSPTKTFNIEGVQASYETFPRKEELERFDGELGILDIKRNNPFSLVAFETAYTKCDEWVNQLNEFLSSNMDYAIDFIKNRIPEVKICKAEGTYLLWLDFSSLGFTKEELSEFMKREAKVAMDDGYWFGDNGIGYERMNIACPRYMLEEGLTRIEKAVKSLRK